MKWGLTATLLSGILMAVSRDTGQFGWLVLIAPVPVMIWSVRAKGSWSVFSLAFLVGVAGEAGLMWFYGRVLPLIYGIAVFQGLIFALAILFLRALYLKVSPLIGIFGYAAMTTAVEYLYGLVSPNGSFGALGYALVEVLPLLQMASITGVAGLSFLAAMVPAGLAAVCLEPRNRMIMAACSLPVAATLVFGAWQLAQPMGPNLRIALLSDDRYAGRVVGNPASEPEISRAFNKQVGDISVLGPEAIVLPEKMLSSPKDVSPPANGILVAGIDEAGQGGERKNLAVLFEGGISRLYLKKRMVPGLEAPYLPGRTELTTTINNQVVGIAICKDMDFASDLRLYGRRKVSFMMVPAWDFGHDRYLHSRMAVVRGVENGFAVARSASQGLMTLSDAKGRIVSEKRSMNEPSALVDYLPAGLGNTVYSLIGDVFAQTATALWLVLLLLLLGHHASRIFNRMPQ